MSGGRAPRRHRGRTALAGCALIAMGVSAVPDPAGRAGILLYLVPVVLTVSLMVVSVRAIPVERRGPWTWLALAQILYLVGETLFATLDVLGSDRWPTFADMVYLVGIVPEAVGLLRLSRLRAAYRGDLLDTLIATLSAAVLFGIFFILPVARDGSMSPLARLVSSAYPILDVMLIFLLARLVTRPGERSRAYWYLVAAQVAVVVADVGWNVTQLTAGGDESPRWMNLLWQASYLFNALAAASTATRRPAVRSPDAGAVLTVPRLVVLAVAAALPSVSLVGLALAHRPDRAVWLGTGSILLVGLVAARIWGLLQQLRSQAAQLARLARTDPLTGLANRRTWDDEVDRLLARGLPDGTAVLVALLDLDHFKAYNDARGHQAGDRLLQAAAAAWAAGIGGQGLLARWGGEEFAVLIATGDVAGAVARLDGLRAVVPDAQTCSIGVTRWDGVEGLDAVLGRADEALYAAKNGGRDRLVILDGPSVVPSAAPPVTPPVAPPGIPAQERRRAARGITDRDGRGR